MNVQKNELSRITIAIDKWNTIPEKMKKIALCMPIKIKNGKVHSKMIVHQQIAFDKNGLLIKIWANALFPKLSVFIMPTIAVPSLHAGEITLARPAMKYERSVWRHKNNIENFWIIGSGMA